jgi:hypothetical protein
MSGNPNLRESLALASRLGCSVRPINRTGEVRVLPPSGGKPVTVNARRKDSPRSLLVMVRRFDGGAS